MTGVVVTTGGVVTGGVTFEAAGGAAGLQPTIDNRESPRASVVAVAKDALMKYLLLSCDFPASGVIRRLCLYAILHFLLTKWVIPLSSNISKPKFSINPLYPMVDAENSFPGQCHD